MEIWLVACRRLAALVGLVLLVSALAACGGAEDRKAKYFERGKVLFDEGNYVKAELEFKNVLQIDPKDVQALYMLGQVAEAKQEWQRAFSAYSSVLELDSRNVPALVKRGHLYRLSGVLDKALAAAQEALQLEPENADALVLRGATRTQMGNTDAGVKDARKALEIEPGNVMAVSLLAMIDAKQGELDKAVALVEEATRRHPDNVGLHLLLAGFFDKRGDFEKAAEMLRKVVAISPDDLKPRIQLSRYFEKHGRMDEAEQALRDAVAVDAESVDARLVLVDFLARQRNPALAEKELLGFIEQRPEDYRLRFGLAALYKSMGKPEQVKAVYEEIIARDGLGPDGLRARNKLAEVLVGEQDLDKAGELVAVVLKENPKDTDALMTRAHIALLRKDPDQAIADMRSILGGAPGNVNAARLLARAHLQKDEVKLAREALEKAVEANPKQLGVHLDLAKLLVATGDIERGVAVLEKLSQALPGNYDALHALGNIQIAAKKWDGLKDTAGQIKSRYPDKPLGYYFMGLAYRSENAFQDSVGEFEQALRRKPDAIQTLVEMSKSYLALEQPEKALALLQQALDTNPGNLVALDLQGEIYLLQKRYDEAEAAFQKVISAKTKWSTPYRNLFNIYMVRKETEKAMRILQDGIAATGDNALRLQLAGLYEIRGDRAAAMKEYEAVLEAVPQSAVAANNLAMLMVGGEPEQASLDKAMELVKGFAKARNPVFLDTLGWVHYQRGEYEEAVSILKQASLNASKYPVVDYHLGLTYLKQGQVSKARESLQKALDAGVDFAESVQARKVLDGLPKG